MQDFDQKQPGYFIKPCFKGTNYKTPIHKNPILDEPEISFSLKRGLMNEDENQENVEKPVVCARCHSLRLYEKVKDPSVENLLPNFDFDHAVDLFQAKCFLWSFEALENLMARTALEEPAFSSLVCIIHFGISQFHYLLVGSSGWMWNYLLFCVCYNLDISTDSTSYGEDRERQHNAGRTFRVSAAGNWVFEMLSFVMKFKVVNSLRISFRFLVVSKK
ncbi:hypothetical protein BC332_01455 [Capsicum chinense]|nr:hypothetical protein BC332_01455 [Capsicum chinense]